MTDLEITRACASAMGLHPSPYGQDRLEIVTWHGPNGEHPTYHIYDPLTNDAQAMALVKKFGLNIHVPHYRGPRWLVINDGAVSVDAPECRTSDDNLNRAICECVAKMSKEKA